ncbi:PREDICTED: solute carrier family 15 member 1 [Acanthisitta chloris]|uniref:solute carrier family 15 member 1 n=1 Tax=Acanthisitta chloris TaxID=57068 RepID=UPI0004F0F754|nr:PREDICTED: solute carrier family 15 member 1 [Acanthisitta chloris]
MAAWSKGNALPSCLLCFGFPVSIFFIVINEFCERFSYYGMKAVLVLYFKYFLHWEDNFSTAIYHSFVALCYLTPILGAIIADSWLGKFKTIFALSIVYTIGQAVLAVGSISDLTDQDKNGTPDNIALHIALSVIGLVLIALGTGGIKPCVSAFGGDQFDDDQEQQRSTFFSLFYLSINAGSLISTLVTPSLKASECGIHSKQRCYPLAFGVPAVLMAVALVVFISGSRMYKKVQPQGNIMLEVSKCIGFAIKNRFVHRSNKFPKREHWLDWASEKYDKQLIAQIKMVLKVLFLYIPLPMFWALFDQQGSRWTLQATAMNGDFGVQIQPEQMQTVNPILIVIMVPVVNYLVYPLLQKCNIDFTPLKKITVGMFLASLAFVAAALVQVQIDTGYMTFEASQLQSLSISYGGEKRTETFNKTPGERFTLRIKNNIKDVMLVQLMDDVESKPPDGNNLISPYVIKVSSPLISSCTIASKEFGFGGAYTISVDACTKDFHLNVTYFEDIAPSTVHMAWQIPQYFLLTCGEVVFSVTGLEFSYSQAPSNMKSVLQAGWLLTVAVGNIIVLIVAGASKIDKQVSTRSMFAALLMAVCVIFAVMAYFYTYADPSEIEAQIDEEEKKNKKDQDDHGKNTEDDSKM